jgi:predicted metalloprotease with PDZ domain
MSKNYSPFLMFFAVGVFLLNLSVGGNAQDIEATIKIDPVSSVVSVNGRFQPTEAAGNKTNLSFMLEHAGLTGLGARFSSVKLTDSNGRAVNSRALVPGEYLAEGAFSEWSYMADLSPLTKATAAAHISWLSQDKGVLMLDDLLPQTGPGKTARIKFELHPEWTITTNARQTNTHIYDVADTGKAVFYVAAKGVSREITPARSRIKLHITDSWLFSDEEAAEMAVSIFGYYEKLFGKAPAGGVVIGLYRFPIPTAIGNWEANTRGLTVTIVSSDMHFKSQSLQRLHEQLRHEIFHLWIPNGLNLTGNYDWFYEGFALYQSLKMAVAVNRIRFDDVLDTLSRVYEIDGRKAKNMSLIDASKRRWTGSSTDVYARGMLVAFLCDLALLDSSNGKRSVSDLISDLYRNNQGRQEVRDGNTAILDLFRSNKRLAPIVDRYVVGDERIDWLPLLKVAGLEANGDAKPVKLKVTAKPSGRQKDLLDKLGYNNWRKLSRKQ